MTYIGLDVSKISTALCLESKDKTLLFSYSTKKESNKWVKYTKDYINYRFLDYNYSKEKDYSKSQINKLNEFDLVTDLIIEDIKEYCSEEDIKIGIEGYSYSSSVGPLIDIVEFTTLLKSKILRYLRYLNNNSSIEIFSPLTVKSECCKLTYKPRIEIKGKRVIKEILHYENPEGKQAIKFDKWDMYNAYLTNPSIDNALKDWCIENTEEITKTKDVPKPLDDIIDAIWIKEIVKTKSKNK